MRSNKQRFSRSPPACEPQSCRVNAMNAQSSTSLRRFVLVFVALAALAFGSAASARDYLSISIGGPGYGVSYSNHGGGYWGGHYSNYRPHYGYGGYYGGYRGPYRSSYRHYAPYPVHRVIHHRRPVVVHHHHHHVGRYDDRDYYRRSHDRYYDRDGRYDRDRYYD